MVSESLPTPETPSRKRSHIGIEAVKTMVKMRVDILESKWGLGLKPPSENSPKKNKEDRLSENKEFHVVHMIQVLGWKQLQVEPLDEFNRRAEELYRSWVTKPKADRGVVPERTRDVHHNLLPIEKQQMLSLLHDILEVPYRELNAKNRTRTLERTRSDGLFSPTGNGQQPTAPRLDDSPLRIALPSPKSDPKRPRRDSFADVDPYHKKLKTPGPKSAALSESPSVMMPPSEIHRPAFRASQSWRSENTSMSESIFSRSNHSFDRIGMRSTQETVPDLDGSQDLETKTRPNEPPVRCQTAAPSSDYGAETMFEGSSFNELISKTNDANGLFRGTDVNTERADDSLSQGLLNFGIQKPSNMLTDDDVLQDRLDASFPTLPDSLDVGAAPLYIIYEVVRVFSHTEVSMADIKFPPIKAFEDYDKLWLFLRNLPQLQGKAFPLKSDLVAWEAAKTNFTSNSAGSEVGVVLSGSLTYDMSDSMSPLFQFKLKPLTLEKKHRLSRRLGEDRFIQIDMPDLHGRFLPKLLQGDRGQEILFKWLVGRRHWLFRRRWRVFHCKPKERKDKGDKKKRDKQSDPSHCVYFFAVDGQGILPPVSSTPINFEPPDERKTVIEIDALLNMIRLTGENTHQPYLKLFSRTSLAVSRNSATEVISRQAIRYKPDIKYNDEVMTDGAGRLSFALAQKITTALNLSYPASGFQGRIGEAKGFWSVDHSDRSGDLWIENYTSQCKWIRTKSKDDNASDFHPANRTFEILKPSGPLKSADLNLQFLPLLMERAIDKKLMRAALERLMEDGLQKALDILQSSVEDAASLRAWVHEQHSSIADRLRHGGVLYEGGLPMSTHERLIMLLDAGFEPKKLKYAWELSKDLFKRKCDELKERLNITIGKSTYVYMVPDFAGILEPDEVYMDFSSFVDDVSGQSGVLLHGQEVLVARSPAHFISDIQKVKAVAKVELMGLKDIVIFPTKGNPSLARKLSGGDYDGDLAWVCWEPSLVDNFVTADVPVVPDLVAQGFVRQDKTTYEELVSSQEHPVTHFLEHSLRFNMKPSMLGICTSFKDTYCYNQGTVASQEATALSALLSLLVDQAKQGYIFDEEDWNRFKKSLMDGKKVTTFQPDYKKPNPELRQGRNAKHIIDYLMYVAREKVDESLAVFQASMPENIPQWDADLTANFEWAEEAKSKTNEWIAILNDLSNDLTSLKESWRKVWSKAIRLDITDDAVEFKSILYDHLEMYENIRPQTITDLTHSLIGSPSSSDYSPWSLLRASALFASYKKDNIKPFVWFMAGKQLAFMKANSVAGRGPHAIIPQMYACYKPNASFIRQLQHRDNNVTDNVGVSNVDELEATQDD